MTGLIRRGAYLGILLVSLAAFLLVAKPIVALLPWGKTQFFATFTAAVAVFLSGAIVEHRLWRGFFGGNGNNQNSLVNPVPPIPASMGAFVGILLALYA